MIEHQTIQWLGSLRKQQQSSATSKTPATSQANASTSAASVEEKAKDVTADGLGTEVLSAIHLMKNNFSDKFKDMLAGISGLKNELQSQADMITETEDRIGRAEDDLTLCTTLLKI